MQREKTVLVTGASRGLGKSISDYLAANGYRVLGTSRNPTSSSSSSYELLSLDVNSDNSVRSCVNELFLRISKLDVLINNAGFELLGATEEISIEEARSQFETNFFGVARMIKAILPYMRKQMIGKIITVSSASTLIPFPFQGYYVASKAALESYTEALHYEVRPFNIQVSLIEPAYFKTDFSAGIKHPKESIPAYQEAKLHFERLHQDRIKKGQDPILVGKYVLKIIENESPPLHNYIPAEQDLRIMTIKQEGKMDEYVKRFFRLE